MAAPRIPYENIDSTRKVTHDYTHAERAGMAIGKTLGKRHTDPHHQHHYINRRHIPLKRLPYNGLLFHYMILESDQTIVDPQHRQKKLIAKILSVIYFDSITYNHHTDRFRICISRNKPKMKYYYTSPIASLGVAGWGNRYNVEICCRIKREVDVAYLKGGTNNDDNTETDLETITQRGSKFGNHPDFDYLRIKNCDQVLNSCGQVGNNNDVCLAGHNDIVHNRISGIYCMAGQDSLIEFNNIQNRDNLTSLLNGPGGCLRTAFNQIYTNVISPLVQNPQNPANPQARLNYDNYMIYMNSIFLTLEADYRLNNNAALEADRETGYLGFSEVTLYALGHHSLANTQFMPNPPLRNPLSHPHEAYTIDNQVANEVTYNVRANDLDYIYTQFYLPMTIVELVGITFHNGRFPSLNVIPMPVVAHNPFNPNAIQIRNQGIFQHGMQNFTVLNPRYSIFHNMFISTLMFGGIDPMLRKVSVSPKPNNPTPNTAANLVDYTTGLNEQNLVWSFLEKALMFQVNHKWRNTRNGRLKYLVTGAFNNGGHQPSISQSIINDYNQRMHANNIIINPTVVQDTVIFTIPGYKQLLTNKYDQRLHSPLYKLRRFFDQFNGYFLIFSSILTRPNIDRIIDYLNIINNHHPTRFIDINNGNALAGGYRKKTRKYRNNKKKTYRKKNKRM